MKRKLIAVGVLSLSVSALALATLLPCNYTIPKYGGVPCNQLPPPPPRSTYVGECSYYFCDENDACDSEPYLYQKKLRTRVIRKAGADPVQYYQSNLSQPDVKDGCCYCDD